MAENFSVRTSLSSAPKAPATRSLYTSSPQTSSLRSGNSARSALWQTMDPGVSSANLNQRLDALQRNYDVQAGNVTRAAGPFAGSGQVNSQLREVERQRANAIAAAQLQGQTAETEANRSLLQFLAQMDLRDQELQRQAERDAASRAQWEAQFSRQGEWRTQEQEQQEKMLERADRLREEENARQDALRQQLWTRQDQQMNQQQAARDTADINNMFKNAWTRGRGIGAGGDGGGGYGTLGTGGGTFRGITGATSVDPYALTNRYNQPMSSAGTAAQWAQNNAWTPQSQVNATSQLKTYMARNNAVRPSEMDVVNAGGITTRSMTTPWGTASGSVGPANRLTYNPAPLVTSGGTRINTSRYIPIGAPRTSSASTGRYIAMGR